VNDLLLPARLQAALGDAYQVERELGGGGMSRLFVATERSLNRQVVIKVLPPELASEVSAARFKKEIEVAAQMQHPHIVPILAAGSDDDLLWYVMPTLAELERARVAEKLGDKARARDGYAYVADMWRNGDASFRQYSDEARAGLKRLSGENAGTPIPMKKP